MDKVSSLDSLRLSIFTVLKGTRNLNLLKRMMELIEQEGEKIEGVTVGYNSDATAISQSQLAVDVLIARSQFENGESITIDELEEESKGWI